jgi:hypothetical protein
MTEQRRHPRIGYGKEVWIGQDGIFSRTNERVTDISVGGAFIETSQSFSKGTILSIRFKVGDATDFISCAAIVRNSRPAMGLGLEFLDLSPEARGQLETFLAQGLAATNGA